MARDGDIELTFTVEALAVFTSVQHLIDSARTWVNSGDWLEENGIEPGSPQAGVMYTRLKDKVAEMERSWHQGVIGLIKLAGGFGELRVMKDGEYSLFFHQPQSGFCGGLIYHPATKDGKRLPYGDFSTHT